MHLQSVRPTICQSTFSEGFPWKAPFRMQSIYPTTAMTGAPSSRSTAPISYTKPLWEEGPSSKSSTAFSHIHNSMPSISTYQQQPKLGSPCSSQTRNGTGISTFSKSTTPSFSATIHLSSTLEEGPPEMAVYSPGSTQLLAILCPSSTQLWS